MVNKFSSTGILSYFYTKSENKEIEKEAFYLLSDWVKDDEFATYQILTIYSNEGVLGYAIREGKEYFIIYHKEENKNVD